MMVYVERRAADDAALLKDESFGGVRKQLCTFREGEVPPPPHTGALDGSTHYLTGSPIPALVKLTLLALSPYC